MGGDGGLQPGNAVGLRPLSQFSRRILLLPFEAHVTVQTRSPVGVPRPGGRVPALVAPSPRRRQRIGDAAGPGCPLAPPSKVGAGGPTIANEAPSARPGRRPSGL
jgi:hypothetical protein